LAKRKPKIRKPEINEARSEPETPGPDSAGQSGDDQGLSQVADADEESVRELVDTDQISEAESVEGLEDAADHPESPARTHEDKR
jgi:hypothetical protein